MSGWGSGVGHLETSVHSRVPAFVKTHGFASLAHIIYMSYMYHFFILTPFQGFLKQIEKPWILLRIRIISQKHPWSHLNGTLLHRNWNKGVIYAHEWDVCRRREGWGRMTRGTAFQSLSTRSTRWRWDCRWPTHAESLRVRDSWCDSAHLHHCPAAVSGLRRSKTCTLETRPQSRWAQTSGRTSKHFSFRKNMRRKT